jgi:hypothetical protein
MWPFETGFFHLAQCFQGSLCCNMYSYFIPLFLPNNIPANEYSTLNLSIYWLMDWFCQYSLFLYLCCSFHSEHFFSPVLCVGSRCTDFLFPMHQNPSGSRLLRKGYKTFDSHTFEKCLYFTLFFFFVELRFELRASCLQSTWSSALVAPPDHFALVILKIGVSWSICLGWLQTSILLISAS